MAATDPTLEHEGLFSFVRRLIAEAGYLVDGLGPPSNGFSTGGPFDPKVRVYRASSEGLFLLEFFSRTFRCGEARTDDARAMGDAIGAYVIGCVPIDEMAKRFPWVHFYPKTTGNELLAQAIPSEHLIDRLPPRRHADLPFEPVTAADIDRMVVSALTPLLADMGFEALGRGRKWVRARPPLRDIFEIVAGRGSVGPHVGISLDFVPHVRGDSVRWHRTNKSAVFDIRLHHNDVDAPEVRRAGISIGYREAGFRRDMARVLPGAVEDALLWVASFALENLVERLEAHRSAERYDFPQFHNWTQQPLAYAFVLARSGRTAEANAALDRWAEDGVSAAAMAQLRSLLPEAGA